MHWKVWMIKKILFFVNDWFPLLGEYSIPPAYVSSQKTCAKNTNLYSETNGQTNKDVGSPLWTYQHLLLLFWLLLSCLQRFNILIKSTKQSKHWRGPQMWRDSWESSLKRPPESSSLSPLFSSPLLSSPLLSAPLLSSHSVHNIEQTHQALTGSSASAAAASQCLSVRHTLNSWLSAWPKKRTMQWKIAVTSKKTQSFTSDSRKALEQELL